MAPKKTKKSGKKAGNAGASNGGGANAQALLGLLLGKATGKGGGGGVKQKDLMALLNALGGGASGGGGGGAATNSSLASFEGDWKAALSGALSKEKGRNIKKEEITYETVVVEGGSGQKFQSTVTIEGQSFNGKTGLGKSGAEKNAAKVALMEMFPDYQPKQKGIKRAADGKVIDHEPNSRDKLHQALAIFSADTQGKCLTKDCVTFETPEGDGQRTATVKINVGTIKKQFQGKGDTRKLAEEAAAAAALKGLAKQIDSVVAAHAAKKKEANKAALGALKDKMLLKKGANQGLS